MKTNNKGITLIALVITIIILLILAAVAIQLALGDNGLITRAQSGKKEQTTAEAVDQFKTMQVSFWTDYKLSKDDQDTKSTEYITNLTTKALTTMAKGGITTSGSFTYSTSTKDFGGTVTVYYEGKVVKYLKMQQSGDVVVDTNP